VGANTEDSRVTHPVPAQPGAPDAAPVPNDAWYLHGQGRRFGPLTEDDMRGYFRAGMVKGNDTVGVPGQVGTVPAADAAAMLGMPAPVAAPVANGPVGALAPASIRVTETGTHTSGVLVGLGVVVAVIGLAYFKLHVPEGSEAASAHPEVAPSTTTTTAQAPAQAAAEWTPGSSTSLLGSARSREPELAPAASPAASAAQTNAAMQTVPTDSPRVAPDDWWKQAHELWGNWSQLRTHAEKWTMAEPRRDLAWWYLGVAHAYLNEYDAAIVAYQQGLALNPSHVKLRWGLANAYAALGRHRESAEILQVLIRENPNDTDLWNDLGYDWAHLGEIDETVAALEQAVKLDPHNRKAWANLSWAYAKFGYRDKSKEVVARANAVL
jgi:hypothetical protein